MGAKRYKPEEIVSKLREAEVLFGRRLSRGRGRSAARRDAGDVLSMAQGVWWHEGRPGEAPEESRKRERPVEEAACRCRARQGDPRGGCLKLVGPSRKRQFIEHACMELGVSERRACRVVGQHRSTQWRKPQQLDDEDALTAAIIALANRYGRYGYRRIAALLRRDHKRVTRECLAIEVARRLNSQSELAVLAHLMVRRGVPDHVRSDNGSEFTQFASGSPRSGQRPCSSNREAARRAAERQTVQQFERGESPDRTMAAPLQHRPSTHFSRLQAASPRSDRPSRSGLHYMKTPATSPFPWELPDAYIKSGCGFGVPSPAYFLRQL